MNRQAKRLLEDLDQEIREHIEIETRENIERGMDPAEARCAALRKFGSAAKFKEEARDVWVTAWVEQLWRDIRISLRQLRFSPGFASVAVLTLALGIGANTAMFSLVDSVLFRELPYQSPRELVWVTDFMPRHQERVVIESDYYAWRAQNRVFTDVAAYDAGDTLTLTNAGEPARLRAAHITYNFLSVLGVQPALGRNFREEEDRPGAPHVALLTDQLWRSRFGASPSILGQSIDLDGDVYSVIGILPRSFEFLDNTPAEVITPIALENHEMTMQRSMRIVNVVARLRPGVTPAVAAADIDAINGRLFATYPAAFANMFKGAKSQIIPLRERLIGKSRLPLLVLLGAVGLVLLIACANIANLLLARAVSREKEVAIRVALGAGKFRMFRQLLTESAVLAAAGGLSGIVVAFLLIRVIVRISPADVPHLSLARLDPRILLFTLVITCFAGLLFGLAPAFAAGRTELVEAFKETGAHPRTTRPGRRSQATLIVVELASSFILLTGSGLLLRSLYRLASVPPGFDPNGVLAARLSLPPNLYSGSQQSALFEQLVARCSALPGVTSAAVASILPLQGSNNAAGVELEGRAAELPGRAPQAEIVKVTPGYFETLHIRLLSGTVFDPRNPQSDAKLMVVNEAFAQRFFPNEDPLGKRVILGKDQHWTITGVVQDVKQFGLYTPVKPGVFIPITREPRSEVTLLLRTGGIPESLLPAVHSVVVSLDKNLPLYDVLTMRSLLHEQTASQRFSSLLLSTFAALAVLLACIGIYGVTAYTATLRTREFGLRMALGAGSGDILRLTLRQAVLLALFGLLLGIAGSLALGRLIASMLFDLQPADPATFLSVSVLLLMLVLAASYGPARRAAQVDPMVALRYQ